MVGDAERIGRNLSRLSDYGYREVIYTPSGPDVTQNYDLRRCLSTVGVGLSGQLDEQVEELRYAVDSPGHLTYQDVMRVILLPSQPLSTTRIVNSSSVRCGRGRACRGVNGG